LLRPNDLATGAPRGAALRGEGDILRLGPAFLVRRVAPAGIFFVPELFFVPEPFIDPELFIELFIDL
jgi:hypothetical protein